MWTTFALIVVLLLTFALLIVIAFSASVICALKQVDQEEPILRLAASEGQIRLSFNLPRRVRSILLTSITIDRLLVDDLQISPPPGFAEPETDLPDLQRFEPDLETLADSEQQPTQSEVEAETRKQHGDYVEMQKRFYAEKVVFAGHLRITRKNNEVLLPARTPGIRSGTITVSYKRRVGLLAVSSGVTASYVPK